MKTEPDVFSIDDLRAAPNQTTYWDGVRNYQARNYMRDSMRVGDAVLVYHSNAKPSCVVGLARVCREAYPDHTAFDPLDPHYDPKSSADAPTWYMVDIQFVSKFETPLALDYLRGLKPLAEMELLRKGSRLSIQPVRKKEFELVVKMGQAKLD
jgi:predicted RNA-binding protein with PUA-like domain